jgi:hypothetical protein
MLYRAALVAILALASAGPIRVPRARTVQIDCYRCGRAVQISSVSGSLFLLDARDLDPAATFDVELVDSTGNRLASAAGLALDSGKLPYPCQRLARGIYYLRLNENGVLRREYAIAASN